jgi:hypothetical protein
VKLHLNIVYLLTWHVYLYQYILSQVPALAEEWLGGLDSDKVFVLWFSVSTEKFSDKFLNFTFGRNCITKLHTSIHVSIIDKFLAFKIIKSIFYQPVFHPMKVSPVNYCRNWFIKSTQGLQDPLHRLQGGRESLEFSCHQVVA